MTRKARARMLSPTISTSPRVNAMSLKSVLVYTWLLAHADDQGRLTSNPATLKGIVCPLRNDITEQDIGRALTEMEERGLALRNNCAIIIVHHTGKPKYDSEGNPIQATPRGSSTISDAVDMELQILTTDRENVTELLCTKSRRTRALVRKGWRRDFFYDDESVIITPLQAQDMSKDELIKQIIADQNEMQLSNYKMAAALDISETLLRNYVSGKRIIPDLRVDEFTEKLRRLLYAFRESCTQSSVDACTQSSVDACAHEAKSINKEYNTEKRVRSPVSNNASKKRASKTSTASTASAKKTKSIDPTNPCKACSARKEKDARFVDGEGDCTNGHVYTT
jgi:predicted transcriptional regulator